MKKEKELTANEILSLIFISTGSDAIIDFNNIDEFIKILDGIEMNDNETYGINMPMNNNFDNTLFEEIIEGRDKGKFRLANCKNYDEREEQKRRLIAHLLHIVGDERKKIKKYRLAITKYGEVYNMRKVFNQRTKENKKETFIQKIKRLTNMF